MQNNFYFLRKVSEALRGNIISYSVTSCFSQSKNELIIELKNLGNVFYIRINTLPDLCCVSFPASFARSKKNNVDLFPQIIGKKVSDVIQIENDRSFAITFGDLSLAILLHGVRANVVLFENEAPVVFFNKKLSRSFNKQLSDLNRPIDISFAAFRDKGYNIKALFPTFDKIILYWLEQQGFGSKSHEDQWQLIEELLVQFQQPEYYITLLDGKIILSLMNIGEVKKSTIDPLLAANLYFDNFTYTNLFTNTKQNLIAEYQKTIIRTKSFLNKTREKLKTLNDSNEYEVYANILMANLHSVDGSSKLANLYNFYTNSEITIPLKENLSPQKNAELYYKKAKNKKYEVNNLESVIAGKQNFLANLEAELKQLMEVQTLKELKMFSKMQETLKNDDEEEEALPFRKVLFDGYEILIGRNSRSNDEMLQKFTFKDDLWLHAKDVTGSHVILKYRSGNNFPAYVIERAAEIAAFNSKRKTDSHCPVTYTPRKFVRKQKGLPPGAVIVEKEKVIIVTPKGF
jgi:predicted ribosome quality control (RQC) complex YloA/Tae2 family protein